MSRTPNQIRSEFRSRSEALKGTAHCSRETFRDVSKRQAQHETDRGTYAAMPEVSTLLDDLTVTGVRLYPRLPIGTRVRVSSSGEDLTLTLLGLDPTVDREMSALLIPNEVQS